MNKLILIAISFLSGMLIPCLSAHAEPRVLVVSVAEEIQNGPDAKILVAIAKELGTPLTFQYAPFKRRLLLLKSGNVDLVCGLLKRPDREIYIHYILPPYKKRSDTIFFVPKGKAGRIQRYEDLYDLKIGTVRGSKFFIRFDEDSLLSKEPVAQITLNFKKLLLGRIDTVIVNEASGIDIMHKMNISDQIEMALYRFNREKFVYIGISKNSWLMDDIQTIEPVIQKMVRSGRIRHIIESYYTNLNLPIPAL